MANNVKKPETASPTEVHEETGTTEEAVEKKVMEPTVPDEGQTEASKAQDEGVVTKLYDTGTLARLSFEQFAPDAYQIRSSKSDIESLMESIKREGLYTPLTVMLDEETGLYITLDGYRRKRVLEELGIDSALCLIMSSVGCADAAHAAYMINKERDDYTAIEIAKHLQAMKENFGFTHSDLEAMGYGTPSHITQLLNLLKLDQSVQDSISEKELTAAHGQEILKVNDPKKQKTVAKQVIKYGYSARKTKSRVISINRKPKPNKGKNKSRPNSPDFDVPGVYFKSSQDMAEVPAKSVDLILGSPSYGFNQEFEGSHTPETIFEEIKGSLDEAARALGPGRIMALNIMDSQDFRRGKGKTEYKEWFYSGVKYQQYLRKHKIYLRDVILWKKNPSWFTKVQHVSKDTTPHTAYRLLNQVEQVLIFCKQGIREDLPSEELQYVSRLSPEQLRKWTPNVWEIQQERGANQEGHPCVYPEELCDRLIKMFSFEGDTVLDPWLGSGTTVKVARDLNRVGIGYERELAYKPVIMEKLGLLPVAEPVVETSNTMKDYADEQLEGTLADKSYETADSSPQQAAEASKEEATGSVNIPQGHWASMGPSASPAV